MVIGVKLHGVVFESCAEDLEKFELKYAAYCPMTPFIGCSLGTFEFFRIVYGSLGEKQQREFVR